LAGGAGEPPSLAEGLSAHADQLDDIEVVSLPLHGVNPIRYAAAAMTGHVRSRVFTFMPELTRPLAEGRVEYVPARHSSIPDLLRSSAFHFDVAFLQGTAGDNGGLNLGLWADLAAPVIANSELVVAELNPLLPRTFGQTRVNAADLDHVVNGELPPRRYAPGLATRLAAQIGDNVADVIPDGATFQIGIGRLADAVAARLGRRRDLGIHSGMISDAVVDLVRTGVVNGRRKEIDTGKIVVSQCLGSPLLWEFLDGNCMIQVQPASYVHVEDTMRAFERFFAINFALEVDLAGRVNAEWMGADRVGAVGGQLDFMRAAGRSPQGAALIALPSTARSGSVSRVVSRIETGRSTLEPPDVGVIVTEYGVADIRGLDVDERRRKLAAIAHPSFRSQLSAGI
jgi:4-hydroxybutyrate CoA-transferase